MGVTPSNGYVHFLLVFYSSLPILNLFILPGIYSSSLWWRFCSANCILVYQNLLKK